MGRLLGENKGAVEVGFGVSAAAFPCWDIEAVELRACGVKDARCGVDFTGLICVKLMTIWPENKSKDRPISTKSVMNPILE
jgi:hypothetical protein